MKREGIEAAVALIETPVEIYVNDYVTTDDRHATMPQGADQ
jgi:hypothetical protein